MSSRGDAAELVALVKTLKAEGFVVLSATVAGVHVDIAQVYQPGGNVTVRPTQSVVEEYGGKAIEAMLADDDEDVPAVRS